MKNFLKNIRAQTSTVSISEKIVEYFPWVILFGILVIAIFLLTKKLGIA